jgi:hypothetical protein
MKPDRPKLQLKKPTPAPVVAVTPTPVKKPMPAVVAKPASAKKPVKLPKPSPEKERLRLENIRLGAEGYARRKAQIEKIKPLIDAYFAERTVFREIVVFDGVECLRPLMIGARKVVFQFFKMQPEFRDYTNTVLNDLIAEAFELHVAKSQYIAGLVKFNERFDLDGNPAGVISEKHKDKAIKRASQYVADTSLDAGYQAMVSDKAREAQAIKWCNALAGDAANEAR